MNWEDLKRCPFCGSGRLENLDSAKQLGQVYCVDCRARGPLPAAMAPRLGRPVNDGLVAWNIRAKGIR